MNKLTMLFSALSFIFAFLVYFSTSSWFVSLAIFLFSVIFFIFVSYPICKKYLLKTNRFHECYNFINNFLISLSVKNTIEGSINSTVESMNPTFQKEMNGIEHLSGFDKLNYISKYFKFDIYKLFLNIVHIYEEQGGNILQMSSLIIEQSRYQEQYLNKSNQIAKKKVIEFSTLWLFSIAILIVLKFVLGQFYNSIFSQLIFQILIGLIFIFLAVSIHILILRITKVEIRGWNNYEF